MNFSTAKSQGVIPFAIFKLILKVSPSVKQQQIVLLCRPYEKDFSIMYVVRLLDTLEHRETIFN